MNRSDIAQRYRNYIACLNGQEWARLGDFVADDVSYNGERIGLCGYRSMLEADFEAIPDLSFNIAMLVSEPPVVASRLDFSCTPKAMLFGLPVNGRTVSFSENVFYEFADGRIVSVWSVIDKAAIAAQLAATV
ncbi:ester cyclase [Algicella marina]|uniref:Ester cyclase n=1 Tax=Algicella marina TaxID=2683284 RepID=A0A6P1T5Y8_9RHOB|nr:ester cyclase [Algicella marina]QHQ35972.1 ester cyclase [Algicella marina]